LGYIELGDSMGWLSQGLKFIVFCLLVALLGAPALLRAQATLLLEEPYSYDGTFAGTGHAAVYLSRVCADTPTVLRRCGPGETGVVVSRYHHIAGRDWIAVPLLPYLYAVTDPQNVPLYADAKLVTLLRSRYQEEIGITGDAAYQLAGSAYDRTTYGFRIATRPEQDDALIRALNATPNTESYKLLDRNCADFAKQIINFYYPHAIHRSIIADLGITTPKQAAKSLARFGKHHPEMQLTRFIIPQVPGLKRSKPVHGVIESLVLAKKYVTPVLLFHPVLVGSVEAAYWAGWRFNPAKDALIFDPETAGSTLDRPLTTAERRTYEKSLAAMRRDSDLGPLPSWPKLEAKAEPELDALGKPFLRVKDADRSVEVGVCRDNIFRMGASPDLVQDLVFSRLKQELKPGKPPLASDRQIRSDFELLQQALAARRASLSPGLGDLKANQH
jgi:hypothetical protein